MASILSLTLRRVGCQLKSSPAALQVYRNYGLDSRPYKPGQYPTTEEEKQAAAAKYNLIPEDYDVWDEKDGYGDYPKFEGLGWDARDPYDDYDCEYDRYFYGEPVHIESEMWGGAGLDPNFVSYKPAWYYYFASFGFFFSFILVFSLPDYFGIRINAPMKPKQFPGPDKVHYTFDPAYD